MSTENEEKTITKFQANIQQTNQLISHPSAKQSTSESSHQQINQLIRKLVHKSDQLV
jgi:hypothetical protein